MLFHRVKKPGKTARVRMAAVIATIIATLSLIAGPASASTPNPPSPTAPPRAIHLQMAFNCTTMTTKAHEYAMAHDYCPRPTNGPTPNAVAYGNCGDSWIYIWDATGGYADIDYGFDSSAGAVVWRNLSVGYAGPDNASGWNDSWWMSSSSYSSARSGLWVGRYGQAYATLGGTVSLWWGGQCTLLEPTDVTYMGS